MNRRLRLLPELGTAILLCMAGWGSSAAAVQIAIGGYDTVAYFTDAKPVPGRNDINYVWHGAYWYFASVAHRDLFAHDPERYAPQYDGYCALAASGGTEARKETVDPRAWAIVDGKLYLTQNQQALDKWRERERENIKRADRDWPRVQRENVVYNGYPNVKAP